MNGYITFFFGGVGVALCVYGVDKSREIGGWAVWIVLAGWSCFWFAITGVR